MKMGFKDFSYDSAEAALMSSLESAGHLTAWMRKNGHSARADEILDRFNEFSAFVKWSIEDDGQDE